MPKTTPGKTVRAETLFEAIAVMRMDPEVVQLADFPSKEELGKAVRLVEQSGARVVITRRS